MHNLKVNYISLVYHTCQTKKMKRENKNKNRWIKSGNGHKKPWDPSKKVRETMVGRVCGKGKFWVCSGTEMEWCIVNVVIMMVMMMMNWWVKDKMTVTGTHHQQVDEVQDNVTVTPGDMGAGTVVLWGWWIPQNCWRIYLELPNSIRVNRI